MGFGSFLKKAFTTLSGIGTVKAALGGVKKMAKGDFKGGLRDTLLGTATGGVMGSKKKPGGPGDAFAGWLQRIQNDPRAMQNPFMKDMVDRYNASQGAGGGVSAIPGGINPAANQAPPIGGAPGLTKPAPIGGLTPTAPPTGNQAFSPGFDRKFDQSQENAFGNPFGSYGGQ